MALKSSNEFFTIRFPTVFKLLRYRVNASSNFAAVTFFTVFQLCRHRVKGVLISVYVCETENHISKIRLREIYKTEQDDNESIHLFYQAGW